MRVLITAVGKRTEHWTEMFAALCERPDVDLTVVGADVSPGTVTELRRLAARYPRLRQHVVPHLVGEDRTGHMASVVFRPGVLHRLAPQPPEIVHVIGEAAYLSTWQVLRLRRRWPAARFTLYAAQNVATLFPPPFPLLERRAFHTVDHVLPITPAALGVLRAKGYGGPATLVPLGVDTDLFQPAAHPRGDRPFTAGFVGRFEPHKGLATLLAAAERIDCHLLLVGAGSLRDEVAAAAARRPGRITVLGWTDHAALPRLLHRMDTLVLPSVELIQRNVVPWVGIPLREQFGRVLVEAMAAGVPVVGSDQGEIPYVIGPAGLLFASGDPAALAERLARLRDTPGTARALADAGRDRATRLYGWDRVTAAMCELWRRLLGPGDHPEPAAPIVEREATRS